jgi:hypothetical protein
MIDYWRAEDRGENSCSMILLLVLLSFSCTASYPREEARTVRVANVTSAVDVPQVLRSPSYQDADSLRGLRRHTSILYVSMRVARVRIQVAKLFSVAANNCWTDGCADERDQQKSS